MYTIATLQDLRRHLGLGEDDSASDEDLRRALTAASQRIESLTQRRYCPVLESREARLERASPRELILPGDLLELRSLRDGGGSIDPSRIRAVPCHAGPASVLRRIDGAPFQQGGEADRGLWVEGLWGWHDRWDQAWRDSRDRLPEGGISAAASHFTVTDSDGPDAEALRPRFHVGHLLRIGGEYLRVIAIDAASNRLAVLRGAQGTVAQTHASGAKIETYAPAAGIRDLTLRFAALMLRSGQPLDSVDDPLLGRMRRLTA